MSIIRRGLVLSSILLFTLPSQAQNSCGDLFRSFASKGVEVAGLERPLAEGAHRQLQDLVEKDPDLREFLENPAFIALLKGVSEGQTVDQLRPLIYEIWQDPNLSEHPLGRKTGALLIGPNAKNDSKLIQVLKDAEVKKSTPSTVDKMKYHYSRVRDQILAMKRSLTKVKALVKDEMSPQALDANLFDFYGYLNLGLDGSRLREWKTPENSFAGVKLSDVKDMDPVAFVKVLMLASQIEAPIKGYSDASGSIFQLFPQAARFMGKTEEQVEFHVKARRKLYCTNSWCEEENRHEGMLENLSRRLVGLVLPNNRPFSADRSLSPYNPADVNFHVMARANNELAASSTYFLLGGHAQGNTGIYLSNIRGDEVKHSTVFAGLYHYLRGDTYWQRLRGVARKMWIEIMDKTENSPYARVLHHEPVTLIEMIYTQVQYEKQIKNYISLLPLKTLRKFFETDINLDPLPEVEMDPVKKAKLEQLKKLEKARREALAGWPKSQREAAYRLEYFEAEHNEALSALIAKRFHYFRGIEDYGTQNHWLTTLNISNLNKEDLAPYGLGDLSAGEVVLLKRSLNQTLRDYQILNNQNVRRIGLKVQFIDAVRGFDIVKDEAFQRQRRIELNKPNVHNSVAQATVSAVEKVSAGTFLLRVQRPEGYVFNAGDSVNVALQTPQGLQTRFLSIANSSSKDYLEFAVRLTDSYFKEALVKLKAGNSIALEPAKKGMAVKAGAPMVMIAGGIGITPFRSILQQKIESGDPTPVRLLYANREEKDIAFKNELDQMAAKNPQISIDYVLSQPPTGWTGSHGRIDKGYLQKVVTEAGPDSVFHIVAALPMVQAVRNALTELGVPPERVVVESFLGY